MNRILKIFTKPQCPYCDALKNLLQEKNILFEEIDVSKDHFSLNFLKNEGHKTVPQIYYMGVLFVKGGFSGFLSLSDEEILQKFKEIEEYNFENNISI